MSGQRPPLLQLAEIDLAIHTLPLRCGACKHQQSYRVGKIIVDPDYLREFSLLCVLNRSATLWNVSWEKWLIFSGYFVCARCGAGDSWQVPEEAKTYVIAQLQEHALGRKSSAILVGVTQMFDGTLTRSAFESEAYLQRLLETQPNSSFLWSRLGNVFVAAEEPRRALPVFLKAVELNSRDVEALHSLGVLYFEEGDFPQAAHYFHLVLRHCREGTWHREEVKEIVVRHALETLFEIHRETRGEIAFLPTSEPTVSPTGEVELQLREFDLGSEEGWRGLVDMFLRNPKAPRTPARRAAPFAKQVARSLTGPTFARSQSTRGRVGRNDSCPCGSGKKFKNCCL